MDCELIILSFSLQSESDQDARGGLMKPTIASQNKANGALRNSNSNLRRRGMQSSGKRDLIDGLLS